LYRREVFAIGVCIGSRERFERCALPGIARCSEPNTHVLTREGQTSICAAYNDVMAAALSPDLEGVVLIHDDTEILDPDLLERLRAVFRDPTVAIAGPVGARKISALSWWEGEPVGRYATDIGSRRALEETSGGPFRRMSDHSLGVPTDDSSGVPADHLSDVHDVDAVDGMFMALSPWAVGNLCFDGERFPRFHGYDLDYCFQARDYGKRVLVCDINIHHHTKGAFGDPVAFERADRRFRHKWGFAKHWRAQYFLAPIKMPLTLEAKRWWARWLSFTGGLGRRRPCRR
jgi:GT2 family glycosyltransferase